VQGCAFRAGAGFDVASRGVRDDGNSTTPHDSPGGRRPVPASFCVLPLPRPDNTEKIEIPYRPYKAFPTGRKWVSQPRIPGRCAGSSGPHRRPQVPGGNCGNTRGLTSRDAWVSLGGRILAPRAYSFSAIEMESASAAIDWAAAVFKDDPGPQGHPQAPEAGRLHGALRARSGFRDGGLPGHRSERVAGNKFEFLMTEFIGSSGEDTSGASTACR
jgi:hypothetical protein